MTDCLVYLGIRDIELVVMGCCASFREQIYFLARFKAQIVNKHDQLKQVDMLVTPIGNFSPYVLYGRRI